MTSPDYIPAGDNAPVIADGAAATAFWREQVMTQPQFRPEVEWCVTLLLDANRKLIGHLVPESDGANGFVQLPKGKILRAVLSSRAAGVVLLHSHPPGALMEPSDADRSCLNTMTHCLEMMELGLVVFDDVIVDEKGARFFSFAEAGELQARAAAVHQVNYKTWMDGLTLAIECLEHNEPRIAPVIMELSAASGLSREQWFADWSLRAFVREFSPEPVEDRRMCLHAAIYSRSHRAGDALYEASRKAGIKSTLFAWNASVDAVVKEWEPPAAGTSAA